MKVIIDIGHARKTGAESNGLEEHEVSCVIASYLVEELRKDGHEVLVLDFPKLSNKEDLNATIKEANKSGYEVGVSLHCDSSDNTEAHGAHVCFYPGSVEGGSLAMAISERLCKLLPGRSNEVQGRQNLAVLKRTKMPFVLCECGFISNAGDAEVMRHRPVEIAKAIAEGVSAYAEER